MDIKQKWMHDTISRNEHCRGNSAIALYMRYIAPLLRVYEVDRQEAALVVLRRKGLLKRITQYDWTGIRDK